MVSFAGHPDIVVVLSIAKKWTKKSPLSGALNVTCLLFIFHCFIGHHCTKTRARKNQAQVIHITAIEGIYGYHCNQRACHT